MLAKLNTGPEPVLAETGTSFRPVRPGRKSLTATEQYLTGGRHYLWYALPVACTAHGKHRPFLTQE